MNQKLIVLRTIKLSESDLIVHGLTTRGGRLNLVARGALKSRKRFGGGVLEPTHFLSVLYKPSRSLSDDHPLHHMLEAQLLEGFSGIRQDYSRLEAALSMLQLISQVAQHGVEDSPEIFDLLGNGLRAAESSDQLEILVIQFEAKLLFLQGVLSHGTIPTDLTRKTLKEHGSIHLDPDTKRLTQFELKRSWQTLSN